MGILVTGGAGFIGSHLCRKLLEKKFEVICLDDLSLGREDYIEPFKSNTQFTFIKGDILDDQCMDTIFSEHTIESIYHFAANSDIQAGSKDLDVDIEKTFLTTSQCLNYARNHNVKSFVFPSSSAVYGPMEGKISEDSGPMKPISFYGASKLASEAYISAMQEFHTFKSWIFRFPNVVGPQSTHGVVYDFVQKLKENPNELTILGDGQQLKPYTYVEDLIEGIIFGVEHAQEPFNLFHLGVDNQITVREIGDIVVEVMGLKDVKYTFTGGQKGWKGDVPNYDYDLTKINKLGWRARLTSRQAVEECARQIL